MSRKKQYQLGFIGHWQSIFLSTLLMLASDWGTAERITAMLQIRKWEAQRKEGDLWKVHN